MRRISVIIISCLIILSGCSFNKFEPYVFQQVDAIDIGDTSDPVTFLRDVENVGLIFEVVDSNLDVNTPGDYTITYRISLKKKSIEKTYTIKVKDHDCPVIQAKDEEIISYGGTFLLADYAKAYDDRDGDVSASLHYTGSIDAYQEGTYLITIYAEDQFGNEAQKQMKVIVEKSGGSVKNTICGKYTDITYQDGQQPTLQLNEDNTFYLYLNGCSVVKLVEGTYKQISDTLYLVAADNGFSTKDEENIVSFTILIDGTLRFDTSLDLCAPNAGDVFEKD